MFLSFFPSPRPFFTSAALWTLFAVLFWFFAAKDLGYLVGLEFRNQRVEAAYRKELVYGEDDANRARPPTLRELFQAVRVNYFRLYFNYL